MRCKPGNEKLAVAYVRVSTNKQELGPEAQRSAIEAWAKQRGVTVVAWFSEVVSGAADLDDRPALFDALAAVKQHGAGILVVQKRDRLARSVLNSALIKRLVCNSGAQVVSTAGEGEGDDKDAQLFAHIFEAIGEWERANTAARTRAALAAKKRRGESAGNVPMGYKLADDDKTLVPDLDEQAIIAAARKLRASGLSLEAVAKELAAKGMLSRKNTPYHAMQIKRMCDKETP